MGSILGKTMEDNFKKQQDFMLEMNRSGVRSVL